jgi:hypothetical protein
MVAEWKKPGEHPDASLPTSPPVESSSQQMEDENGSDSSRIQPDIELPDTNETGRNSPISEQTNKDLTSFSGNAELALKVSEKGTISKEESQMRYPTTERSN